MMPMSQADFLKSQNTFISVLARSAGVPPKNVTVLSVTEISGRRALQGARGGREGNEAAGGAAGGGVFSQHTRTLLAMSVNVVTGGISQTSASYSTYSMDYR